MPLNRVSFYGKNHAIGYPSLIKIMRQGLTIDKKIMRQGIMWKDAFQSSLETMDFGKIFMRQGILLGYFLCDRVQGVERFATHPRHFPCQVPPPRDPCAIMNNDLSNSYKTEEFLYFWFFSMGSSDTFVVLLELTMK